MSYTEERKNERIKYLKSTLDCMQISTTSDILGIASEATLIASIFNNANCEFLGESEKDFDRNYSEILNSIERLKVNLESLEFRLNVDNYKQQNHKFWGN